MELGLLLAALRGPSPADDESSASLCLALADYADATERMMRADAEAAVSRRPSTLKATLKSAVALERARQHILAELRLVGRITDPPPRTPPLRLCG